MKKLDQKILDLIPISESVKILEEQFPHLRDIKWNSKEDEDEDPPVRKGR
jgi:hypothetical protein